MTAVNYINASLEIWGCVISAVAAICIVLSRRKPDKCGRLYFWMLGCSAAAMFFDAAALFLRGRPGPVFRLGVRVSNFLSFSMGYALLESFTHYLTEYLGSRGKAPRGPLRFCRCVCFFSILLIVINRFFPIIYTVDGLNFYRRAAGFWLSQAAGILGMLANAYLLLSCRASISGFEKAALWSYIVLPAAAMLVQAFVYGVALLYLADTVSIVVIFLFLQAEQGRRSAEQENRLTQSRISIMLSQIQPHFLYNALSVIQDMCHGRAPDAEKATIQFSEFLRGNLDSLQASGPIPFPRELSHTKNYLWLESCRFGGDLRIEYDIGAENFSIPALTLQPIVENAVRYGVLKKEGGGTVRISSRAANGAFTVTVTDDGVGFDPMAPKEDGRTHIGISNVGERLRIMCGGSLSIKSTPGKGTVAMISVPEEAGA